MAALFLPFCTALPWASVYRFYLMIERESAHTPPSTNPECPPKNYQTTSPPPLPHHLSFSFFFFFFFFSLTRPFLKLDRPPRRPHHHSRQRIPDGSRDRRFGTLSHPSHLSIRPSFPPPSSFSSPSLSSPPRTHLIPLSPQIKPATHKKNKKKQKKRETGERKNRYTR